jgi:hypothetical protein
VAERNIFTEGIVTTHLWATEVFLRNALLLYIYGRKEYSYAAQFYYTSVGNTSILHKALLLYICGRKKYSYATHCYYTSVGDTSIFTQRIVAINVWATEILLSNELLLYICGRQDHSYPTHYLPPTAIRNLTLYKAAYERLFTLEVVFNLKEFMCFMIKQSETGTG